MGASYWLRVVMMILAFIGIVMTIRNLNTGKPIVNPFVGMLTQAPTAESHADVTMNLCPTRATSLEVAGVARVFEEKMKWYRTKGSSDAIEALDIIAVEQWFAKYCSIKGTKTEGEDVAAFAPLLELKYVDGSTGQIDRADKAGQTLFRWNGQSLLSPGLEEALLKFSALPSAKAPGTH